MSINTSYTNAHAQCNTISNRGDPVQSSADKNNYNTVTHSNESVSSRSVVSTHVSESREKTSGRFKRLDGSVFVDVNNPNFYTAPTLRRGHSFSERRGVQNRELHSILERKAALQTTDRRTDSPKSPEIRTPSVNPSDDDDRSFPGHLRRTQSLRDRYRNRNRPDNMTNNDFGFSLSDILRDDLANLRGGTTNDATTSRLERRRLSDASDNSYGQDDQVPDVPPRTSTRSRLPGRFKTLTGVPENTSAVPERRRASGNLENTRVHRTMSDTRWSSTEELSHSSSIGNLSADMRPPSPADSTISTPSRLTHTGRFREQIQESQRSMFESIGKELKPRRSSEVITPRRGQSASLANISADSTVEFDSSLNVDGISELRNVSMVESRVSRLNRRLQRSCSDVTNTQIGNFQRQYRNVSRENIDDRSRDRNESREEIDDQRRYRSESRDQMDEQRRYRKKSRDEIDNQRYRNESQDDTREKRRVEQSETADDTEEEHFVETVVVDGKMEQTSDECRYVRRERKKDIVSRTQSVDVLPTAVWGQLGNGNMKELLEVKTIRPRTPTGRRKLILDEQKLQELFLKCHVCGETYTNDDKLPKLLPCHHTFCMSCLSEIHRVETEHRKNMSAAYRSHIPVAIRLACPICRDAIIVTDDELKKLPHDRTVLALLEVVTQSESCVVTYCSKHQTQPLNFFCETCVLPVCCDCTVLEHNQQQNHSVMNIEEALGKYVPMIETTLDALDDQYRELVDKKATVEVSITSFRTNKEDVTGKLKETFSHFRAAADDRQEELVEIIQGEMSKKREELKSYLDAVKQRRRELGEGKSRLLSAQEQEKISDMYECNKQLKDCVEDSVDVPEDFTEESMVELEFDEDEQQRVITKLTDFGDVNFDPLDLRSRRDRN